MPDEKAENITDMEQQAATEDNPLTSVARSVGSVIGAVASGASKVLSISQTKPVRRTISKSSCRSR